MARQKIGEYKAKKLVTSYLGLPYHGLFFDSPADDLKKLQMLDKTKNYVVKVDQGIKKRFKNGLVKLNVKFTDIPTVIKELEEKGYTTFLLEEYQEYQQSDERYLAIERTREGLVISFSKSGGVDIEEHQSDLKVFPVTSYNLEKVARELGIEIQLLEKILEACDLYHFSFLEINPFIIHDSKFIILDLAVEVDSAGEFFVKGAWSENDVVDASVTEPTQEEKAIEQLSGKSQASFRLVVLNPQGSIWMLLSGGGASIVVADEVYNQGYGKELANYGEYSGNPNAEETYLYTKQILSLLLKSKAKRKCLIIAGGVANFTDIRITFKGVIQALDEVKSELLKQSVRVYVRRGGPYQEEGLTLMREYLEKIELLGEVSGPEMVMTDIVAKALEGVGK